MGGLRGKMKGKKDVSAHSHKLMWGITGILIVISILVMYRTHRAIPFMMDDLWYSTVLSDDTPITSFSDIITSQIWHYHNWGGRSMTHGILQLTLLAGEKAADILNVVFTLLLAGMVCQVSGYRKLPAFLAAMGMVLGLNANWRMSMFWQAGAANYLYITVFLLAFAYCYLRELPDEGSFLVKRKWGEKKFTEKVKTVNEWAESKPTPKNGREGTRQASGNGCAESRQAPGNGCAESRQASGNGCAESRQASGNGCKENGQAPGNGREESSQASENGCVKDKQIVAEEYAGDGYNAAAGLKRSGNLFGITLWIIPLGILAGWSNENMGPAMWILSLVVILLALKEKRKVKLWMILGNLACLAGSILCIAAPGNFVRSSQIKEQQYGTLWKIFLRSYAECKAALEFLFPTLLVLGFLWVVSSCVFRQALGRRNALLLFCALLSWGAMFLSPHYPDRASFGTMVLCICVILSLARKILQRRSDLSWVLWGGAVLIWLRGMYFCGEYLAVVWGWIK